MLLLLFLNIFIMKYSRVGWLPHGLLTFISAILGHGFASQHRRPGCNCKAAHEMLGTRSTAESHGPYQTRL